MDKRKIILDLETTGLSVITGDKIVEIAMVEIIDDSNIGEKYHKYINPERPIPIESSKIHGITDDKVRNCPTFKEVSKEIKNFIGESQIIAHNGIAFDKNFLNTELSMANLEQIPTSKYIDTYLMAKKIIKTSGYSLDKLCDFFNISRASRKKYHGAMIDVMLLYEVYKALINYNDSDYLKNIEDTSYKTKIESYDFPYRKYTVSSKDVDEHKEFCKKIKNPIGEIIS